MSAAINRSRLTSRRRVSGIRPATFSAATSIIPTATGIAGSRNCRHDLAGRLPAGALEEALDSLPRRTLAGVGASSHRPEIHSLEGCQLEKLLAVRRPKPRQILGDSLPAFDYFRIDRAESPEESGPQRIGERSGGAAIIPGAGRRQAVPKSVELLRVEDRGAMAPSRSPAAPATRVVPDRLAIQVRQPPPLLHARRAAHQAHRPCRHGGSPPSRRPLQLPSYSVSSHRPYSPNPGAARTPRAANGRIRGFPRRSREVAPDRSALSR